MEENYNQFNKIENQAEGTPGFKKNLHKPIFTFLIILAFVVGFCSSAVFSAFNGPLLIFKERTQVETAENNLKLEDPEQGEKGEKVRKENSVKVMEILDNQCYEVQIYYDGVVNAFAEEIEKAEIAQKKKIKKIDYGTLEKYVTENNDMFKGFLSGLKENRLALKFDTFNGYYVTPDFKYFIDKYSKFVNKDTINYLKFRLYETKDLYKESMDSIDIDEVVKRIDYIDKQIASLSEYTSAYLTLKDYYLGILKSENHEMFYKADSYELIEYAKKKFEELSVRDDKVGKAAREVLKNNGKPMLTEE